MQAHTRWLLFGGSASPHPTPVISKYFPGVCSVLWHPSEGLYLFTPDEQGMACTGTYCTRKQEE